uniref:Autophagy-related protein 2 n=1 Tax=Timema bartmani TaxID=61472 RepID=A0A7R9I0U8_9NEOP|nr:unnamed protein product [Timema bartmani]
MALNELGEQQNFPVEFVDGFISEMCVSIPWASLLSDSSFVEVKGLTLTVQPKQRADTGTSMFESMWSSMTSSLQLAKDCFKQERADTKDAQESQPLEGLELFAQTIDSILSRVKVKFLDTVIRVEHVPKDSISGVGLEIRIKSLDYFDEAGADPPAPSTPEAQLQQGNKMYQVAAFTTKKFYLNGITLYTDEFPSKARTFSRSVMTMSSSSTPDSKNFDNANTAPVTPSSSSPPSDSQPHSNLSTEANPILFGKLNGCQEVRLRLKQSEVVVGPKVDIEVNLGSLTMFLSARQLHVLLELLHGLATPDLEDTSNVTPRARCLEKPMDSSDFHRVEQELLHQLQPPPVLRTKGLQNTQGWSTASLDDSDEEFLPMKGGAMIDSMLSSVTSMDGSVLSSVSSVSTSAHRYTNYCVCVGAGVRTLDTDPNAEVSHFHVRLSSVMLVLLHEDILTLCVETDGSSLARSSVQQMKSVAQHFFSEIGLFAVSGYDNKDFIEGKKVFERACQLNHIRLLAAPVIIEGNEKTTSLASSISGRVTAASLELLECLVDKPAAVEVVEVRVHHHLRGFM